MCRATRTLIVRGDISILTRLPGVGRSLKSALKIYANIITPNRSVNKLLVGPSGRSSRNRPLLLRYAKQNASRRKNSTPVAHRRVDSHAHAYTRARRIYIPRTQTTLRNYLISVLDLNIHIFF